MYNGKGLAKLPDENWHFDKYRDPHEFPALSFPSDDEFDQSEIGNGSSSAHLSGKVPKISDDEFRKLFHLRNQRKRSGLSNTNPLNNVPPLVFKEKSNLLDLKDESKFKETENIESRENKLLSASTPKFNTFVSGDKEINENSGADKNLAELLSSTNLNGGNDGSQFSKLLEKIEQQALKINELETELNKTSIQKNNFEMEVERLEHDFSNLQKSASMKENEISYLKDSNLNLQKTFSELQSKNLELERELLLNTENSEKWKIELTKERMMLRKERELNTSLISDHEEKIAELNKEKSSISSALRITQAENNDLKTNLEFKQQEFATLKLKFDTALSESTAKLLQLEEDSKREHEKYEKSLDKFNEISSKHEALVLDHKDLEEKYNKLKTEKLGLEDNYSALSKKQEQVSVDVIKLKAELSTKLQITKEELEKVSKEKHQLENVRNELEKEVNDYKKRYDDLKSEILGTDPITQDRFGGFYQLLEMDKVDKLTLTELQNIVKNILKSLNIKFSDLKDNVLFIRDDIFKFFAEIHSILHSYESNKMIVVDKSIKPDLSDKERLKVCMEVLVRDIKKLKGLE